MCYQIEERDVYTHSLNMEQQKILNIVTVSSTIAHIVLNVTAYLMIYFGCRLTIGEGKTISTSYCIPNS